MAWEENPRICLHMQLIAILSRTGVTTIHHFHQRFKKIIPYHVSKQERDLEIYHPDGHRHPHGHRHQPGRHELHRSPLSAPPSRRGSTTPRGATAPRPPASPRGTANPRGPTYPRGPTATVLVHPHHHSAGAAIAPASSTRATHGPSSPLSEARQYPLLAGFSCQTLRGTFACGQYVNTGENNFYNHEPHILLLLSFSQKANLAFKNGPF